MNVQQQRNKNAAAIVGSLIVTLVDTSMALNNDDRSHAIDNLRHARTLIAATLETLGA
jgi:hypothetical protein